MRLPPACAVGGTLLTVTVTAGVAETPPSSSVTVALTVKFDTAPCGILSKYWCEIVKKPLDKFVTETIGIDDIEAAFAKMHHGDVLRSVVTF